MPCTSADDALIGQRNIVLRRMIDKVKTFLTLIFLLVISPSLGVLVGIYSNNAKLGIVLSAVAFAPVIALQGFASWMHC